MRNACQGPTGPGSLIGPVFSAPVTPDRRVAPAPVRGTLPPRAAGRVLDVTILLSTVTALTLYGLPPSDGACKVVYERLRSVA